MWLRTGRAAALALAIAGCLETRTIECADGRTCPAGTVCDDVHGLCIFDVQREACAGLAEDAGCEFGSVTGHCDAGVCLRDGCGDGFATAGEECDRDDWRDVVDCRDLDYHQPGALACLGDCTFDRSECSEHCGDLERNGDEDCDDQDLGGVTCETLGYYEPAGLSCTSFCTFDIGGCSGRCGDGIVNGDEVCDDTLPTSGSCLDFGYDAGPLGCSAFCTHGIDDCRYLRWMPESTPAVNTLAGWVAPNGDLFMLSSSAVYWQVDGIWSSFEVGSLHTAIWGSSGSDVFVVGYDGRILHFDGTTWSPMESNTGNDLMDVWGSSPDDVFAVGEGGRIIHYDGDEWTQQTSGTTEHLRAVSGSGPGVVFAVGENGTVRRNSGGDTWSTVSDPASGTVVDVWVESATSVHAITTTSYARYDGANWFVEPVASGLHAIWGTSAKNLYVADSTSDVFQSDGDTWVRTLSQPGLPIESFGGTADDVVAIGGSSDVLRSNGSLWQIDFQAAGRLLVVERLADGSLIAVGPAGRVYTRTGSTVSEIQVSGANFKDVWGVAHNDAWAIDFNDFFRRTSGGWTRVTSPFGSGTALWGTGANDVFATRGNGDIYHFAGSWSLQANVGVALLDVWGAASNDVFAVGLGGAIHHYDGMSWSPMESPTTQDLYRVEGTSGSDVWAAGAAGTVLHYDGDAWTVVEVPLQVLLTGLSARTPDDVVIAGSTAGVAHFDGTTWSRVRFPAAAHVLDDVLVEDDRVIVVGTHGLVELARTVPW